MGLPWPAGAGAKKSMHLGLSIAYVSCLVYGMNRENEMKRKAAVLIAVIALPLMGGGWKFFSKKTDLSAADTQPALMASLPIESDETVSTAATHASASCTPPGCGDEQAKVARAKTPPEGNVALALGVGGPFAMEVAERGSIPAGEPNGSPNGGARGIAGSGGTAAGTMGDASNGGYGYFGGMGGGSTGAGSPVGSATRQSPTMAATAGTNSQSTSSGTAAAVSPQPVASGSTGGSPATGSPAAPPMPSPGSGNRADPPAGSPVSGADVPDPKRPSPVVVSPSGFPKVTDDGPFSISPGPISRSPNGTSPDDKSTKPDLPADNGPPAPNKNPGSPTYISEPLAKPSDEPLLDIPKAPDLLPTDSGPKGTPLDPGNPGNHPFLPQEPKPEAVPNKDPVGLSPKVQALPEPDSLALMGIALGLLMLIQQQRRAAARRGTRSVV